MPAKSDKQAKFMRACAHGWKPKGKTMCPSKKIARKFMKTEAKHIDIHKDGDMYVFVDKKTGKVLLKTNEKRVDEWALYFRRKKRATIMRRYDTTLPAFKEFHSMFARAKNPDWKMKRAGKKGIQMPFKGKYSAFSTKTGAFQNR